MLKAELSRFKVKEGKSGKVDEWMAFLNEHMEDTLFTLENEKMFVESIQRNRISVLVLCTGRRWYRGVRFRKLYRYQASGILGRMYR